MYAFWDSKERTDPGLNIALYAHKTVDDLLEEIRTTPSHETREEDILKVEGLIADDFPAAFLYSPRFAYILPSDLKGVTLPQIVTPSDRFAQVATWYRVTEFVWPPFARR